MTNNSTTIWLNQAYTSATRESDIEAHLCLCKCDPYLVTFRDTNKCLNCIRSINDDNNKIILIISNEALPSSTILQQCEEFSQIDSIYILNASNTGAFEPTSRKCKVYTCFESFCDHLRHLPNIRRLRREGFVRDDFTMNELCHLSGFSTQSTIINQPTDASSSDIVTNRQETEFMYAQILRDILIQIESTKEEMVEFCRQKYAGNETYLNTVDEFEEYYEARNAIFWYTRDTFLYRLLNKALREQEYDTLYSLRYFIKDLHFKIIEQYASQLLDSIQFGTTSDVTNPSIKTIYRGQLMTNEDFDKKIRNNKGFLSVNNFFSTTIHKRLAKVYAGNRSKNEASAEQSVLFEIEIGENDYDYANISKQSAFEGEEEEILFSMGAVFRIISVNLNNDEGFWNVKMRLNLEVDDDLTKLTACIKEETFSSYPLLSLGTFFLKTANYDKAEQFHLLALNELTIKEEYGIIPIVYDNLGFIYKKIGKQEKSIEYYEISLDMCKKNCFSTISKPAYIHYNQGAISRQQGDYDRALRNYRTALKVNQILSPSDDSYIAEDYNNIASVYLEQQHYSEALEMFKKSLPLLEKEFPANHPSVAACYGNISQVYCALGHDIEATEYLNKTLTIQLRSLLPNHPDLAASYKSLGLVYYRQNKLKEALEMYEKAMQIQVKCVPSDHPDIATTNNNILEIRSALNR